MNIFENTSFANFNVSPLGVHNTSLQLALNSARNLVNTCQGWLCIYGPPGTGKTHLCYAVRNELRGSRQAVNLIALYDLRDWLNQRSSNRDRKIEAFLQVETLIVDSVEMLHIPTEEIAAEAMAQFVAILNKRATNGLATMLALWDSPTAVLPEVSFLHSDVCTIIRLDSIDYRQIPTDLR